MSNKNSDAQPVKMAISDVYFVIFRWKWLILASSLAGILAAAAVCYLRPQQYKSDAELSLSVLEANPISVPGEEQSRFNDPSINAINTEIEILQSLDLARQVVQALTPQRILSAIDGGSDTNEAAYYVRQGLTVEKDLNSSVIHITFQHPDKEVAQTGLREIIDRYFVQHAKIRGGGGVFEDFLTNETARLRTEIIQTQKQIQEAQSQVGVLDTDDAKDAYSEQITKLRTQIADAQEELAERQAVVAAVAFAVDITNSDPAGKIPSNVSATYQQICSRLTALNRKVDDYLTQQNFTEQNVLVKEVRSQIAGAQHERDELEQKYPQLNRTSAALQNPYTTRGAEGNAMQNDAAAVATLQTKIDFLRSRLNQVWTEATNFERVQATISALKQKQESAQANLKYFTDHQERQHIDAALNESKASNISIIQSPTPPQKGWSKKFKKKIAVLAASGILVGLGLAFLIEMVLDRSVKRPVDIENKLRLPLFISIPDFEKNGYSRLTGRRKARQLILGNNTASHSNTTNPDEMEVAAWEREHPLRRFYEGLRDRLIVYFEVRSVAHNPKLVAVTSCGRKAGVSSIAAGLAATLSETGDGNVLLVNISGEQGAAQQFYKGELGYSLDEVLENDKTGALVKASLYVAAGQANGDMLPANLPKKLSALMPKLKASQYDYIIFDMPPVNQTTATARLSGLMDMVLLVIESEKTNQDSVKQVNKLLGESKANISTVLNKTHDYVPNWLHQEYLNGV